MNEHKVVEMTPAGLLMMIDEYVKQTESFKAQTCGSSLDMSSE